MEAELTEEFAQFRALIKEQGLKHVESLGTKTKDALMKLSRDVDDLKGKLTRYKIERDLLKENRGQMEDEIEELKVKLRKKESENRSLHIRIRELQQQQTSSRDNNNHKWDVNRRMRSTSSRDNNHHKWDVNRRKRSTSSRDDDNTSGSWSDRDGNFGCSGGKRKRDEKPTTNDRHDKHEELYELEGLKRLSLDQIEREMKLRSERRRQMLIQDLTPEAGKTLESIRKLIKEDINIDVKWSLVETISEKEAIVEVDNLDHKIDIINKRHRFKQVYDLYFVDHQTEREKEVLQCLKELASKERCENGKVTMVKYMKISIDGVWRKWDERLFKLVYDWKFNKAN